MVEKIIIGKDKKDLKEFGDAGTVFIGKHIVGEGEDAHLTNPVFMDVTRPHVMLISGKRGSGKSYTSSVIAEEITALPKVIKQNISVLMIDTMGIFWSMNYPNERDRDLLEKWNLKPKSVKMNFFVPEKYVEDYDKFGIPVHSIFKLKTSDMSSNDWSMTFGFSFVDPTGIAIERVVKKLKDDKGDDYSIEDIIAEIEADDRMEAKTKNILISRFNVAQDWGLFDRVGTPVQKLFQKGQVSVLDVSHFERTGTGWSVRGMLVGLLSRRIFQERLTARKAEEFEVISGESSKTVPMVWLVMDEAHQFVPNEGHTVATEPILTLVKEGREPGISLCMITQRPNKLHPDVLAQSDIVLSHRLTAKEDITALQSVMQTYMRDDIKAYINKLPKQKGTAILIDDNSERIFPIQVRPRLSWHAGGSPSAIKKKGIFDDL